MTNPLRDKIYRAGYNASLLNSVPLAIRFALDVGCGDGITAKALVRRNVIVDAITLSDAEAELAAPHCRKVFVHNLEQGLPDAMCCRPQYDCVICSHVLEHICQPDSLLADIASVLIDGGYLVVAIPNLLFYRNRLALFAGHIQYEDQGIMDATHYKWYTFESAQRLLGRDGFVKVSAFGDGAFPLAVLRRILPKRVAESVDRIAVRAFPGLFGYQLIFVYQRVRRHAG